MPNHKISPFAKMRRGALARITDREKSFYIIRVRRMISDILSLQPSILIQPADTGKYGQEKQPEHKVGRSAQKFVQFMSRIEEEERGNHDDKPP
jgi:hypothetical protein